MELPSLSGCQRFNFLFLLFNAIFITNGLAQQNFIITDEDDNALIGVEVYSKDYSITGISNKSGVVTLPAHDPTIELMVNYLGYQEQQITLRSIINNGGKLQLIPSDIQLEEIILIGRNELSREALPYHIESISQEKLQSTNPQTSADALSHHGNVYVQKSQSGGGSPVIRGFEANKLLLVVDGVRMNNAIYRNGHLQNAITVDPAMLESLEVIFGPNSLTYGSDALGGVVHFKSKLPKLQFKDTDELETELRYSLRHSTANQEKNAHVDFNIGGKKFASLTSLTYSDYSDLRTGSNRTDEFPDFGKRLEYIETINGEDIVRQNDDPNLQLGTEYTQYDVLQKFLFQPNDNFQLIANFQFSTSSDIPRYDQLIDREDGLLRFAEWNYGPQQRFLASVKFKFLEPTTLFDKAIFITSYQNIHEDRISRRVGQANRSSQLENVNTQGFTVDFTKELSNQFDLYYGANIQHDFVQSTAFDEDINTNVIDQNVLTRYPSGGSDMTIFGAYTQLHYATKNDLGHLNLGFRASGTSLSFSYLDNDPIDWPENFTDGISSKNSSFIWSAGWSQRYKQGWKWRALISTAFRSPNIDDIAKIRIKGDEITFPNPDLQPERSLNAEYSIGYNTPDGKHEVGATAFLTELRDAIIRLPFQDLDGNSTFDSQGSTFIINANINAERARISGLSINLRSALSSLLEVNGGINFTKGIVLDELDGNSPLAHIPPLYGNVGIKYQPGDFSVSGIWRFNAAKDLEDFGGSADNPEFATSVGSLGWSTFNVYTNYKINPLITVSVGLENIADTHYRPFASGVSAAGRNAILSVNGKF
jgi:hemoglobin/transferrin/lactoferrin receptor protein